MESTSLAAILILSYSFVGTWLNDSAVKRLALWTLDLAIAVQNRAWFAGANGGPRAREEADLRVFFWWQYRFDLKRGRFHSSVG